ncbi:MAG TPA: 3'-5' exonuclease, partial [Anaerohalosphaeraceae bacterium]|nr:3'-5' exonuclease [Anaerohalosphaeraceae bacterium]
GLKIIDPQKDVAIPTLAHQVLAERKRKTLLEEEMRILYVALTRARETLIVSAARKESPCRRILLDCAVLAGRPVPAWQLLQVQCPIDWVLWGLGDQPALQAQYLGFVFAGPCPDFFTVRRVGDEELKKCTRFIEAARQILLQTTLPEIPPD